MTLTTPRYSVIPGVGARKRPGHRRRAVNGGQRRPPTAGDDRGPPRCPGAAAMVGGSRARRARSRPSSGLPRCGCTPNEARRRPELLPSARLPRNRPRSADGFRARFLSQRHWADDVATFRDGTVVTTSIVAAPAVAVSTVSRLVECLGDLRRILASDSLFRVLSRSTAPRTVRCANTMWVEKRIKHDLIGGSCPARTTPSAATERAAVPPAAAHRRRFSW